MTAVDRLARVCHPSRQFDVKRIVTIARVCAILQLISHRGRCSERYRRTADFAARSATEIRRTLSGERGLEPALKPRGLPAVADGRRHVARRTKQRARASGQLREAESKVRRSCEKRIHGPALPAGWRNASRKRSNNSENEPTGRASDRLLEAESLAQTKKPRGEPCSLAEVPTGPFFSFDGLPRLKPGF